MFAIIQTGGKQYKVEKGQTIKVEKLSDAKEGTKVDFDRVLMVSDKEVSVGAPYVSGANVAAKVVSNGRGEKIIVFKMKAKKRYQKTQGHRQDYTEVEITDITTGGAKKAAPKKEEAKKEEAPKKVAKKEAKEDVE